MTIANSNVIAKVAAVVAGLSLVFMSFSFAKADTTSDLQAQIASLLAQIQTLQAQLGTAQGTSATVMFSTDLTIGSKGADVTALQNWLIGKGYSIPAGATGFFGSQTQAAVAKWQAAAGISPAAGFFGPKSRAAVNAMGSTTTGGTTTGGTVALSGTGRLTNVSTANLGDITTDIKAGDGTTKILGVSADATDGDVQIQRVNVNLVVGSSGSQSSNIDKYISDVSLYLDGKKLASMNAADGDKSTRTWSYSFTGLNGVIKKGNTGYLYVEVTPLSTIGTNEDGKGFTATFPTDALRAVGSDGLSETYITTYSQTGITVSSATTGTLTASPANDNPAASQVAVSSSTTSGVTLLAFNLKAKNTSSNIQAMEVNLTTSDNNLSDVISTLKLMKGSTVLQTKTVTTGSNNTVLFDNVNETIAQDATQEYTLVADLKADSAYTDGTTIIASTTASSNWDVTDSTGASVTPSAAVSGNTLTLTANGISVAMGTPTAVVTTAGYSGGLDHATFTIPLTITAGDTAIWIGGAATATTTTTGKTGTGFASNLGVVFATTTTSSATTSASITASVGASDTKTQDANSNFYVGANSSRTLTLTVATGATANNTPNVADRLGIVLTGINYAITSTMGSTYYTSNISTFKTADVDAYYHP